MANGRHTYRGRPYHIRRCLRHYSTIQLFYMTLTPGELLTVTDLQRQQFNINADIQYLTSLAKQLASDKCELKVSFEMHNKTVCANNKINEPDVQMENFTGIVGFIMGKPIPKQQCHHNISMIADDCSGPRILQ